MRTIHLPSRQVLLAAHSRMLDLYGGAPGLRDEGAREAALARPQQLLTYGETGSLTVARVAAALCVSLCRHHHPFIDGNKRVGFMAAYVTLGLNGHYLDVAESEATRVMLGLAAGDVDEDAFTAWLSANSYPEGTGNDGDG